MKKLLLNLHFYIGLAACAFLAILGFTGAVLAFENEFNREINPRLLKVQPRGPVLSWEVVRQKVQLQEPAWRIQRIYMPANDDDSTYVRLVSRANGRTTDEIYVDQYSGEVLGQKLQGNQLIWKIHDLHVTLTAGNIGSRFVAWSAAGLLCLSLSGLYLWWPRKVFRVRVAKPYPRANYDLHRSLGFWSSLAMLAFAVTGINLHIQTGGGLFTMMDDKSAAVHLPGHGTTADEMLQSAREALPEARTMRISFWNDQRPVLVQMRFAEDHTPAGRSAVTLDSRTGAVLTVVSSRTAPLIYTALVEWNREIHTGTIFGWPSRIVASILSMALFVLAVSGPMIWVNNKLAAARGRRKAAARRKQQGSLPAEPSYTASNGLSGHGQPDIARRRATAPNDRDT
ncbi:MAG: PepSY domain-containing protein [Acidobacteriota bacterium]|nr:PepSY domain-containing protein [Acidobacteriota bacterium]